MRPMRMSSGIQREFSSLGDQVRGHCSDAPTMGLCRKEDIVNDAQ